MNSLTTPIISNSCEPLKITVVIGSFLPFLGGVGGHYFSALTTIRKLREVHTVELINVGEFPAPSLQVSDIHLNYFDIRLKNRFSINRKELFQFLNNYDPDVVIAFDAASGWIVRSLCIKLGCGFILVKPGGGRPNGYYPNNSFQIHYTLEDVAWAKARSKYPHGMITCIPNRVAIPKQDLTAINQLKTKFSIRSDEIILIRVGRINKGYEPSFISAIRLANFLRESGYPARLIIIGICQSLETLDEIKANVSDSDIVLTSDEFIKNTSRFLKIAHINVGVGRGFMEGCALKQHMLAINAEDDLPTVVTQENFEFFFAKNFSMRVRFPTNSQLNKERIIEIAENCVSGNGESKESEIWFKDSFSENMIPVLYKEILYKAKSFPEKWSFDVLQGEFKMVFHINTGIRRFLFKKTMKAIKPNS